MVKINLALCLMLVVLPQEGELFCKIPSNNSRVWRENVSNVTLTVDTSSVQVCSRSGQCADMGSGHDDSFIPQLQPITVQHGIPIRLEMTNSSNGTDYSLYKADEYSFITCDIDNSSLLSSATRDDHFLDIDPDDLTPGSNYFLLDSVETCTSGARINISVLTEHRCNDGSIDTMCSCNGQCSLNNEQGAFQCQCCSGFTGTYCEIPEVEAQRECGTNTCLNGGTCVFLPETGLSSTSNNTGENNSSSDLHTETCVCSPHFTGPFCEVLLNHCQSTPCVHGVCVERVDGYQCYCIPGFHGRQCQLEYNECLSLPCQNKGTCVDKVDLYDCACSTGYSGRNCETKVDLCHFNPCHRNASCTDHGDYFSCSCHTGHTGRLCETPVNECASNPCQNHGTCRDLNDGYQCLCPITFAGVHCEYMMDVFAPPLEGADTLGKSHTHNFYVVAGTLSGAIVLILIVLAACYCKMHEAYRQITWRRLRHGHRSMSCPDFESCNETISRKHRLSVDAICEATNLSYDHTSHDSTLHQPLNTHTI